jgi:hypothetical protein
MSRRRAFVWAAPTIALIILIGCGRFGTGDTSSSSSSGSSGSSSSSGGSNEGGGLGDGGGFPDALPPPTDGALCSPMPGLCNGPIQTIRFDQTALPNDWDAAGPVVIQDEAFCSPRALRAEATIPGEKTAVARHRFGRVSQAHLRYALRGPAHIAGAELKFGCSLFFFANNPADQTSTLRFEIEPTGALQIDGNTEGSLFQHEGEGIDIPLSTNASTWRVVDLIMSITTTKISVVGTFDGKSFSTFVNTAVKPDFNEIRCGIEEAKGTDGAYVVYIDDIQLETCP